MTTRRQGPPVRFEVDTAVLIDTVEAHRARLLGAIERLEPGDWDAPTRCVEWKVRDLVAHLRWGTEVGNELMSRVARGSGERLFAGFDPRRTPGEALAPLRSHTDAENLAAIREGDDRMLAAARALAAAGVEEEADTPLGWVPWPLAVNHLLWDSWLHERDLLLPLGAAPAPDPGEVGLVASYQLVPLGSILARVGVRCRIDLRLAGTGGGAYRLDVGDAVAVDHPTEPPGAEGCIRGDAVTVIEAMSGRGDLAAVAEVSPALLRPATALAGRLAGA